MECSCKRQLSTKGIHHTASFDCISMHLLEFWPQLQLITHVLPCMSKHCIQSGCCLIWSAQGWHALYYYTCLMHIKASIRTSDMPITGWYVQANEATILGAHVTTCAVQMHIQVYCQLQCGHRLPHTYPNTCMFLKVCDLTLSLVI